MRIIEREINPYQLNKTATETRGLPIILIYPEPLSVFLATIAQHCKQLLQMPLLYFIYL